MSYTKTRSRTFHYALSDVACPPGVPTYLCNALTAGATGSTTSQAQQCVNRANASPTVSSIDSQIANLASTWKPTGYYTVAEMQSLVTVLESQAQAAGAALAGARSIPGSEDAINQAFDDLIRKWQVPAKNYSDAIVQAKAQGLRAIDAPDAKDWVIRSMQAISDAYVTVTVMYCMQTWVESWLTKAYNAMRTIEDVVRKVVGVLIEIGEKVLDAGGHAIDLIKYLPYAALGIAGWVIYNAVRGR